VESVRNERSPVKRGYANTPRGQIHYAEAGEGPPLILLSATPRTHRCFLRLMAILKPSFRAIAIDMPGFGNSHSLPDPPSIPALAGCLVDFLDAMGIERTDVFGLHTGNKLAAALAAQWPARVARLILAGQSHSIIPEMGARNAAIQPWFEKYQTFYEASPDGAHLVRDWLGAHTTASDIWWPAKLRNGKTIQATDIQNAEARVIDFVLGWRSAVPVYEAVFAFDLADAYARISCPTLVLELRTAQEAHIGGQAERVCALIRNSRAESLLEMDGLALEMRPEEFARPILGFLGR
jgi:pimeloyl-ACP methyl ester carboxylesterase